MQAFEAFFDRRARLIFLVFSFLCLTLPTADAKTYYVSKKGDNRNPGSSSKPWRTIQKACNTLRAGDAVYVRAGTYNEKITVNVSGNAAKGYITFRNNKQDKVIISGSNKEGENIITLRNKNYVRIMGFDIRNNASTNECSGIRVLNSGNFIEIKNNKIHNIRGKNAMGITVYAKGSGVIRNLTIDKNEIYDCEAAPSEALALNGNVWDFKVTNNKVHNINNIGIDFIGGEETGKIAKRGLCRGNIVYKARSNYDGGYAAGIYVDGAADIIIEKNKVHDCDLGIEVGAENAGVTASGIIVQNNLIYNNDKSGLVFGGYDQNVGAVEGCTFQNNTLYRNQVLNSGVGELWIQYNASGNTVKNNMVCAGAQNILLSTEATGNVNNILNYNGWRPFSSGGTWIWNGQTYNSMEDYVSGSGQDAQSFQGDPLFVDDAAFNLRLQNTSPCLDAGDPNTSLGTDFAGTVRPQGLGYDIGAYEIQVGQAYFVSPDGNDENVGSLSNPWKTLQHALDTTQAWNTIYVRAGTYNEALTFQGSGITLAGYPNESVIIDGTNLGAYGIDLATYSNTSLQNLTIRNFSGDGFGIVGWSGNDNTTIRNVILSNVSAAIKFQGATDPSTPIAQGIVIDGVQASNYTGAGIDLGPSEIQNVTIRNVQLVGPGSGNDTAVDGIAVEKGANILIEGTTVTGHSGDGIDLKADQVQVRSCSVLDQARDGVKLWGSNATLENSRVTGSGGPNLVLEGSGPYIISNNIIGNTQLYGYTATLGPYDSLDPSQITLENNIFFNQVADNAGTLLYFSPGCTVSATDNQFYQPYRTDAVIDAQYSTVESIQEGYGKVFGIADFDTGNWPTGFGNTNQYAPYEPQSQ